MSVQYHVPLTISEIATGLVEGQSTRTVCPFCNGGSTHESSFHMTREGAVAKYICYRASCPAKGRYHYGGVAHDYGNALDKYRPPPPKAEYPGEYKRLTVPFLQYMMRTFDIKPAMLHHFGAKQTLDNRVLLPILRPDGTKRGDNVRFYPELVTEEVPASKYMPKSIIYRDIDEIALGWYRLPPDIATQMVNFNSKLLIVVEDQVSALKASRVVDAVALLGTSLSMAKIAEIAGEVNKSSRYERVVILLDADAFSQAAKHMNRTRALFKNVSLRRLVHDVKDMWYPDIVKLLDSCMTVGEVNEHQG